MLHPLSKISASHLLTLAIGVIVGLLSFSPAVAELQGELIRQHEVFEVNLNEENPEEAVNLTEKIQEHLTFPEECNNPLVVCQHTNVNVRIDVTSEHHKFIISELSAQEFAQLVPRLENPVGEFTDSEIVIAQETLDRRGLLTNIDGSRVPERGYWGSLSWKASLELAHIKGRNPGDPDFEQQLTDDINALLDNFANDYDYLTKWPLPSKEQRVPQDGDATEGLWKYHNGLATQALQGGKKRQQSFPLDVGIKINVDGFVNGRRVSE